MNTFYYYIMDYKSFLRHNWVRVVLLLLVFIAIIFLASILFCSGLGFTKRTWGLRSTYMIAAVLWVFFTVRWLCLKYDFAGLWRGMMADIYGHKEDFLLKTRRDYQELVSNYPLAIAEYESHCWHQNPRPTQLEIMESALAITEYEWIEREKKARQKISEKGKK